MARGFGATFGSASTDIITTTYTANATQTSYSVWMRLNPSITVGQFPRIFQKDATTNNFQCIYIDSTALTLIFQYGWSTSASATAAWFVGSPFNPTDGNWHHILLTYDNSSTSNNPVVYIDGVLFVPSISTAPSGTATTNSDPYTVGNRSSGTNRGWDGRLAEFAVWEGVLLTAGEALALTRGARPPRLRSSSLKHYLPLYGLASPEPDLSGNKNNGTLSGTASSFGPPIMPLTPRWVSPALVLPGAGLDWIIRRRNKLRIEGEA